MARRQIKCIRQNAGKERHERITHVGGDWGTGNTRVVIPESDAIYDINKGINSYYVMDKRGDVAEVEVVRHHSGKEYLRTKKDSTTEDNLLSLPTC